MNKTLKKNSSFTLIELLVVIVIIGILAGLVTIAATSFINNSHNARMVAELAGISKKLIGETEFPRGNFCMEDGSNEAKKLLDFLEMEKAPEHPLYKTGETHLTTNECFLYFSDGEHYSIRVPTVGNKGYLIQESRNPNPQGIQEKCEEGWIPFGNRCVMKYEAKGRNKESGAVTSGYNGLDPEFYEATSVAEEMPWGGDWQGGKKSLKWEDAKNACEAIGAHLITNAEWMALARDIENQGVNWSTGTVGSGTINRGHSDNKPNISKPASTDDDPWYGLTDADDELFINKRTHVLSNGQIIWDLAGNMLEWVDEIIPAQEGITGGTNGGWGQINAIDWENSTNLYISYTQVGPKDQTFTSSNGIGRIWKQASRINNAFIRGGYYVDKANAGVFSLNLANGASRTDTNIGFRCTR